MDCQSVRDVGIGFHDVPTIWPDVEGYNKKHLSHCRFRANRVFLSAGKDIALGRICQGRGLADVPTLLNRRSRSPFNGHIRTRGRHVRLEDLALSVPRVAGLVWHQGLVACRNNSIVILARFGDFGEVKPRLPLSIITQLGGRAIVIGARAQREAHLSVDTF